MRKLLLGIVVVCVIFFVSIASADEAAFMLSGNGFSTMGTFYGPQTAPGTWLITNASGQFNGITITGVWPTSNNGNIFAFNNLYYWPAPNLDVYGIVVTLQDGGLVNFCYDAPNCALPGEYAALLWEPNTGVTTFNADSVYFQKPIPEPATLALVGTGVLGLFGSMRRRFF